MTERKFFAIIKIVGDEVPIAIIKESYHMNKLATRLFTAIAGILASSIFVIAPNADATGSSNGGCVDPKNKSVYETTIERGKGTLKLKGGKALCAAQEIVFESFNVPDTWNKKGWNSTAIPQTKFASTSFTIPAGVKNFTKTVTVDTPNACKHTQLDFYLAPEYTSITTLTGDDERNILGILFAGKGSCETPSVVKDIQVCDIKSYKVITIKETAFDSKLHSKDAVNCKAPVEKCPIEGKEHLPKNSKDCASPTETPKTPEIPKTPEAPKVTEATELPRTGLGASFASLIGAGSLTASGYYYITSLRNRNQ